MHARAIPLMLAMAGCAPALPVLSGALPTPVERGAALAGVAARIPLGSDLPDQPNAPGGVAPVVAVRYGLGTHTDVGLMAVGPLVRADVQHAVLLEDDITSYAVTFGLAPYAGPVDEGGVRWGAQVPVLLTVDAGSVVLLWIGPRLRFERASSDAEGDTTGIELGGVLGVGLGFRHFHGLVELSAAWERWWAEVDRSGTVLTPAFALRLLL